VTVTSNNIVVAGIEFGGGGIRVSETWRFEVLTDQIVWRINRTYKTEGTLEESCLPGWEFRDMSTWTGGLLGNGGVAWGKLFDAPNASYCVHTGNVSFWNKD
jgi:hypothetical protein